MRRIPLLAPMFALFGCWSANDTALFSSTDGANADAAAGATTAGAPGSSSAPAQAGTGSSTMGAGGDSPRSRGGAGGSGATGGSNGGVSAAAGNAGNAGNAGSAGAPPIIESCSMLLGAITSHLNGHCYRVNFGNLTFAGARDACAAAGGHLVTLSDQAEDNFVRDLHQSEHWIGATDGRPDTTPGPGLYSWVNQEPWVWANWEGGQPNAYETGCPGGGDSSHCYEHCAYQAPGGQWIDRSCWHTIVSVCEWDVEPLTGMGGAGGTPP